MAALSNLQRLAVALICVALVIGVYGFALALVTSDPTNDFTIYRLASEAISRAENPYLIERTTLYQGIGEVRWRYLYPPVLASILALVGEVDSSLLFPTWSAFTALAIVCAGVIIWRRLDLSVFSLPLLVTLLVLWPPSLDGLERGQINAILLGVLALWWQAFAHGAFTGVAISASVGALLKLSPVLLLMPLIVHRRLMALSVFAALLTAGVLAVACVYGGQVWVYYLQILPALSSGGDGWNSPENLSLSRLLYAIFPALSRRVAQDIQIAIAIICLILILVELRLTSSLTIERQLEERFRIGARLILVMYAASPLVWYHHGVWILIPFWEAWRIAQQSHRWRRTRQVSLVLVAVGVSFYRIFEERFVSNFSQPERFLLVEPTLWLFFAAYMWNQLSFDLFGRRIE